MRVQVIDLNDLYTLRKGRANDDPFSQIIREKKRKGEWPQRTKSGVSIHRRRKFDPIRQHLEWERSHSKGKFE